MSWHTTLTLECGTHEHGAQQSVARSEAQTKLVAGKATAKAEFKSPTREQRQHYQRKQAVTDIAAAMQPKQVLQQGSARKMQQRQCARKHTTTNSHQ